MLRFVVGKHGLVAAPKEFPSDLAECNWSRCKQFTECYGLGSLSAAALIFTLRHALCDTFSSCRSSHNGASHGLPRSLSARCIHGFGGLHKLAARGTFHAVVLCAIAEHLPHGHGFLDAVGRTLRVDAFGTDVHGYLVSILPLRGKRSGPRSVWM